MRKKPTPKTVTEQILITVVADYTWVEGKGSDHDLHNDLLYRIQKAIDNDYPMTRFNVMSLNAREVKPKK